jgi:hypothetical protein
MSSGLQGNASRKKISKNLKLIDYFVWKLKKFQDFLLSLKQSRIWTENNISIFYSGRLNSCGSDTLHNTVPLTVGTYMVCDGLLGAVQTQNFEIS